MGVFVVNSWVGYEHEHFRGRQYLWDMSDRGEYNCTDRWCGQGDRIASVRSVKQVRHALNRLRIHPKCALRQQNFLDCNEWICGLCRIQTLHVLSCLRDKVSPGERPSFRTTSLTSWQDITWTEPPQSGCWVECECLILIYSSFTSYRLPYCFVKKSQIISHHFSVSYIYIITHFVLFKCVCV